MVEGSSTGSSYVLMGRLASGGMGTVYRARRHGEGGFVRDFALKRLHPHFAEDPDAVRMFLDEARLAALVRHPNVVTTIDVGRDGGEFFVVMDLVEGASVELLLAGGSALPPPIAYRIALDTLSGLGAAHDVRDADGTRLDLVHRDVSPANVLVGRDGVARLTDFGIAKARQRLRTTVGFELKGKLAYMAPEQLETEAVDARADLFAMGVVLWEMLRGTRLLHRDRGRLRELQGADVPEWFATGASSATDRVILRALRFAATERFASAQEMSDALAEAAAKAGGIASAADVGQLVATLAQGPASSRRGTSKTDDIVGMPLAARPLPLLSPRTGDRSHDEARHDEARHDEAGHDEARHDEASRNPSLSLDERHEPRETTESGLADVAWAPRAIAPAAPVAPTGSPAIAASADDYAPQQATVVMAVTQTRRSEETRQDGRRTPRVATAAAAVLIAMTAFAALGFSRAKITARGAAEHVTAASATAIDGRDGLPMPNLAPVEHVLVAAPDAAANTPPNATSETVSASPVNTGVNTPAGAAPSASSATRTPRTVPVSHKPRTRAGASSTNAPNEAVDPFGGRR